MVKLFPASGKQFVGVALMPHIKNDLILRRFQHTVQRHGQLYGAKIRGQMATCLGDISSKNAVSLRKVFHLLRIQLLRSLG